MKNILMPNETLADYPLDKVPESREVAQQILDDIRESAGLMTPEEYAAQGLTAAQAPTPMAEPLASDLPPGQTDRDVAAYEAARQPIAPAAKSAQAVYNNHKSTADPGLPPRGPGQRERAVAGFPLPVRQMRRNAARRVG